MFADTQNLVLLIVFVVVGVILLVCCIYCCVCRPACVNARQGLVHRQLKRDEEDVDQERTAHRAQLHDTLSSNQKRRDDIRDKYRLR